MRKKTVGWEKDGEISTRRKPTDCAGSSGRGEAMQPFFRLSVFRLSLSYFLTLSVARRWLVELVKRTGRKTMATKATASATNTAADPFNGDTSTSASCGRFAR